MKKKKVKIGIVGFGKFGTLVSAILSKYSQVFVYNRTVNKEVQDRAKKIKVELVDLKTVAECDVVILTVAISVTKKIIKEISPFLKPGVLVLDTCSVKVQPVKWLKKYLPTNVNILATHPMFGPVTTNFNIDTNFYDLSDKQIVLCPIRLPQKKLNKIKTFLSELGVKVIITTPGDHDRQNAKTLSFVHFLGRALNRAGIKEQRIFTPGYTDLLRISPHTNSDKWQLFCDMHEYNAFSEKVRYKFILACDDLEEDLNRSIIGDDLEFNRQMIDLTDKRITQLLERRMKYSENIGKIKKRKGLKVFDLKREQQIIKNKVKQTKLSQPFIKELFTVIFKYSKKIQK